MLQAAPPAQSQGSQLPYTEDQQRQGLSGSNNDATKGWGSNAMYAGGGAVAATLLGKMFSGSQHHGSNGGLLSSLFGGKSVSVGESALLVRVSLRVWLNS